MQDDFAEIKDEILNSGLNLYGAESLTGESMAFIVDGKEDITTCTVRNTAVLETFGYRNKDILQKLAGNFKGCFTLEFLNFFFAFHDQT